MRKAKMKRKHAALAMDLMQDQRLGPGQAMDVVRQKVEAADQQAPPMQRPFSETKNLKKKGKKK